MQQVQPIPRLPACVCPKLSPCRAHGTAQPVPAVPFPTQTCSWARQLLPCLHLLLHPGASTRERENHWLGVAKKVKCFAMGIQPSRSKFCEKNHSIIFNVLSHVCKISWPVLCCFSVKFSKLLNLTRKLPRHLSTEFRLIWLLMFNCRNQP